MKHYIWVSLLLAGSLYSFDVEHGIAAQGSDPDWPCIQRKVPELTLAQIWTGAPLPEGSVAWREDEAVKHLVPDLAARRLPIGDAEHEIDRFAKGLASDQRSIRLSQLISGLFETMNHERTQIISGIARYAHGQNKLAQALREETAALDTLREAVDSNPIVVDQRQEYLIFRMRIFQERAQSLSYVCEVPTLVEQRLFALTRHISKHLSEN